VDFVNQTKIMSLIIITLCICVVSLQNVMIMHKGWKINTTTSLYSSSVAGFTTNVGDLLCYEFTVVPNVSMSINYNLSDLLRVRVTNVSNLKINGSYADCVIGFVDFFNQSTQTWTLDWLGIGGEFLISAYNGTHPIDLSPYGYFTWGSSFFFSIMFPTLRVPLLSIAPSNHSSINESMVVFYDVWFTNTFPTLNYSWNYSIYYGVSVLYSWSFWAGSPANQTIKFEYIFDSELKCVSNIFYANNSDNTDWEKIYQLDLVTPSKLPIYDYWIILNIIYNQILDENAQNRLWVMVMTGAICGIIIGIIIMVAKQKEYLKHRYIKLLKAKPY
jgi:hypothetical protein